MPTQEMIEAAFERHYTPKELGELWGFDCATITRWFRDERGVLKYQNNAPGKREYVSIRIPSSVAKRVHDSRTR